MTVTICNEGISPGGDFISVTNFSDDNLSPTPIAMREFPRSNIIRKLSPSPIAEAEIYLRHQLTDVSEHGGGGFFSPLIYL
ncbi:MAG: hypothetical protein Q3982_06410, partial [Phoenicibacter congonensis]|nr:hypothetical protein [Phoenicibacter congonensis]